VACGGAGDLGFWGSIGQHQHLDSLSWPEFQNSRAPEFLGMGIHGLLVAVALLLIMLLTTGVTHFT